MHSCNIAEAASALIFNHKRLYFALFPIQVEYRADTIRLSLLELARAGNRLVSVSGRLQFQCHDLTQTGDPLTHLTADPYMVSFTFLLSNDDNKPLTLFRLISSFHPTRSIVKLKGHIQIGRYNAV